MTAHNAKHYAPLLRALVGLTLNTNELAAIVGAHPRNAHRCLTTLASQRHVRCVTEGRPCHPATWAIADGADVEAILAPAPKVQPRVSLSIVRTRSAAMPVQEGERETVAQFLARCGGRGYEVLRGFVHDPDLRRRGQMHYRQGGAA